MWSTEIGSNVSVAYYSNIYLNQTDVNSFLGSLSSWLVGRRLVDSCPGPYCNATWDDIFCWPPTLPGVGVTVPCYEIMKNDDELEVDITNVTGDAYRLCMDDGTWLWGNWTNYNQCADNIPQKPIKSLQDDEDLHTVRVAVTYILFIGSILSLICLSASLIIFYHFKSLRCDRVTVHVHLMLALLLRSLLVIIITEPFIFNRTYHYRTIDWCCKLVLSLQFYATVASVNWMFVQGHYLHSRLTTNIFDRGLPLKAYLVMGWGVPLFVVGIWCFFMVKFHPVHCWKNYGELSYSWIIVGPMLLVLVINLLFIGNILRILLTKITLTRDATESEQIRRAMKATIVLVPLLGINNLLFVYNPGGTGEIYYMFTNVILQSTQGVFVAVLYCFICKDVRDAFRREYGRFNARRNASNSVRSQSLNFSVSCRTKFNKRFSKSENTSVAFLRSPNPSPASGSNRSDRLSANATGVSESPYKETVVLYPTNNNRTANFTTTLQPLIPSSTPTSPTPLVLKCRETLEFDDLNRIETCGLEDSSLSGPVVTEKVSGAVRRWSHGLSQEGRTSRENKVKAAVSTIPVAKTTLVSDCHSRPRIETDIF